MLHDAHKLLTIGVFHLAKGKSHINRAFSELCHSSFYGNGVYLTEQRIDELEVFELESRRVLEVTVKAELSHLVSLTGKYV